MFIVYICSCLWFFFKFNSICVPYITENMQVRRLSFFLSFLLFWFLVLIISHQLTVTFYFLQNHSSIDYYCDYKEEALLHYQEIGLSHNIFRIKNYIFVHRNKECQVLIFCVLYS